MSLDKFLKKSKSSKKTEPLLDNKPETEETKIIDESNKQIKEDAISQEPKNQSINQENVTISYDDLLTVIKQIPSYSDYLTEAIWILEDGTLENIEEYLSKHYELSMVFIKVLLKEAKKILSEKNSL
ncbi:MAG: hypothetical protein HeimC3_01540 [Candidatus Heimdallarchaeota archaeon LC_3]|nr:MAG: hypothetical protein HeimC3_01540 [Candidatus Heimdallarchaeota archaeon LC_3]